MWISVKTISSSLPIQKIVSSTSHQISLYSQDHYNPASLTPWHLQKRDFEQVGASDCPWHRDRVSRGHRDQSQPCLEAPWSWVPTHWRSVCADVVGVGGGGVHVLVTHHSRPSRKPGSIPSGQPKPTQTWLLDFPRPEIINQPSPCRPLNPGMITSQVILKKSLVASSEWKKKRGKHGPGLVPSLRFTFGNRHWGDDTKTLPPCWIPQITPQI